MIARALRWSRAASSEAPKPHDAGLRRVGTRLAVQTAGLVLVMLVVLEVVVYLITQQALLGSLETTLKQRSNPPTDFVARLYNTDGDSIPPPPVGSSGGAFGPRNEPRDSGPNPDLNPSDASSVFVNPQLRVVHADGALGPMVLDRTALLGVIHSGQTHCCDVRSYRGEDYLVYTNPLYVGGQVIGGIQSSISEHQYENTMQSLLQALLVVLFLGLIGAGGVSLALVQRSMRPIRAAIQRQRDFVADAAHELRTPLAIQRTVAEVGMADDTPDNRAATVEQMLVENKHLTRLVDDLSLLARADSNAVTIGRAPMDLSSLVSDTTSELQWLAEERGMHLTLAADPDIWISGDVMRLRQLLLVLLDNALKYTPAGGTVDVQLHARSGRPQLRIGDSGPGIDPTDLPRIFDRFYRADKARTGEGSGLGLAIAKWIVEAHGGAIQAGNATPHGAIFTATFPHLLRSPAASPTRTVRAAE